MSLPPESGHPARALAALHRQASDRIHAIADGLDDAAFNASPSDGSWSVGACVEHLSRTSEGWLGEIEPAVDRAVERGGPRGAGPFEYGFAVRRARGAMGPGGPALRTPRPLDPAAEGGAALDPAATLARFDALSGRLVAVCDRTDGLDLARIRVGYPFRGRLGRLIRLPLGAALEFSGLHALRHAEQAARARGGAAAPPYAIEPGG